METPVKIGFAVAVLIAFAVSVKVFRDRLPEAQGVVKVVARLDEHTAAAGPDVSNTIPTFLELPGELGILPDPATPPADAAAAAPATPAPATPTPAAPAPAAPAPENAGAPSTEAAAPPAAEAPAAGDNPILPADVQPILETELQKGYCTASLTRLVRQRYPGTYDSIPDSDLEKSVLKQHPEYKGRICVFPAWITASPHTIIKYEIERGVTVIPPSIWIWSAGLAVAFGLALLTAYKKFIEEPAAAARSARSSSRPRGRA